MVTATLVEVVEGAPKLPFAAGVFGGAALAVFGLLLFVTFTFRNLGKRQ